MTAQESLGALASARVAVELVSVKSVPTVVVEFFHRRSVLVTLSLVLKEAIESVSSEATSPRLSSLIVSFGMSQ